MSEFIIRAVKIDNITKHPKADTLSYTDIGGAGGYRVIFRTDEFAIGDIAVYVPVGSAVPASDPRWAFLVKPGATKKYVEIEAKRLREVFSMGILTKADASWVEGQDLAATLGIVRAEDVEAARAPSGVDQDERGPGTMPIYTSIFGLRQYPTVLQDGEEVVLTLKVHGENARYCIDATRLYCGSHTKWKKPEARTAWTVAAERLGLEERLRRIGPDIGVFGELYGNVNGMRYDADANVRGLRLFDAMNLKTRTYLDYDDFVRVAAELGLPTTPVLHRGPWSNDLRALADGSDPINPAHVREGFVVKPTVERVEHMGRVILKCHGEAYLLKKWKVTT